MLRKTIKAKLAQVRRPPWQLLMTSVSDDAPAPIAGTNSAPQPHLRTILQLRSLTCSNHRRRYPRDASLCMRHCN